MSKGQFPTMLNLKATMIGSLNRHDLIVVGAGFLILSWFQVSGIFALVLNALALFVFKLAQKRLKSGFIKHLSDKRHLKWAYLLKGVRDE